MIIADELRRRFEPVAPYDFYAEIFRDGDLDEQDAFTPGKYCAIALEITKEKHKNGKTVVYRHTITNDLDGIDELLNSENFCIMAPVTYAGKTRHSENARVMYALCVELDNLRVGSDGRQDGLWDLVYQWEGPSKHLPRPTFCVASGRGIHLYYVFEQPLLLYPKIVKSLVKYKTELTKRIWNRYTTTSYKIDQIQFESVFQAFRMPGTLTKDGERAEAFRTGERVSVEYMNSFIPPSYAKKGAQITEAYKTNVNLKEAQAKWPEWYERRIVQGDKKVKKWDIAGKVNGDNPYALYDWWYRKISDGARVGKRYYCLWTLVIYAIKCDVPRERLEEDCFKIKEHFDKMSVSEKNRFTDYDVMCALQSYDDAKLITYPINSIINRSGIEIKKNKRNGRKRSDHVKLMNYIRDEINQNTNWRNKDGRPQGSGTAQETVLEWRKKHPDGKKAECVRDTNLSKPTVYKWWDSSPADKAQASDPWSHDWIKEEVDEWTKEEFESYIFLGHPRHYELSEEDINEE